MSEKDKKVEKPTKPRVTTNETTYEVRGEHTPSEKPKPTMKK